MKSWCGSVPSMPMGSCPTGPPPTASPAAPPPPTLDNSMLLDGSAEYSLQWSDFGVCLSTSFRELRARADFVDVTLACSDGRSFQAHKALLSICSPYLRCLLKGNPCSHPILILHDVSGNDMEALLEYMYQGQVRVSRDRLHTLVRCAETLQIRGISEGAATAVQNDGGGVGGTIGAAGDRGTGLTRQVGRKRAAAAAMMAAEAAMMQLVPRATSGLKRGRKGGGGGSTALMPLHFHHHRVSGLSGDSGGLSREENGGQPNNDSVHGLDLICVADDSREMQVGHGESSSRALALLDPDLAMEVAAGGGGSSVRRRNASDRPTACPLCGSTIRQARNLRRHLELMHFNGGRPCLRVRGGTGGGGSRGGSKGGKVVSGPATTAAVLEVGVLGVGVVSVTGSSSGASLSQSHVQGCGTGGGAVGGTSSNHSLPPPPPTPTVVAVQADYTKEMQLNPYSVMISNQMAAQAYFSHLPPPPSAPPPPAPPPLALPPPLPPPPPPTSLSHPSHQAPAPGPLPQDLSSSPDQYLIHRQNHLFLHHHHHPHPHAPPTSRDGPPSAPPPPPPPTSVAGSGGASNREGRGGNGGGTGGGSGLTLT